VQLLQRPLGIVVVPRPLVVVNLVDGARGEQYVERGRDGGAARRSARGAEGSARRSGVGRRQKAVVAGMDATVPVEHEDRSGGICGPGKQQGRERRRQEGGGRSAHRRDASRQ
jgi:hypothetical protein